MPSAPSPAPVPAEETVRCRATFTDGAGPTTGACPSAAPPAPRIEPATIGGGATATPPGPAIPRRPEAPPAKSGGGPTAAARSGGTVSRADPIAADGTEGSRGRPPRSGNRDRPVFNSGAETFPGARSCATANAEGRLAAALAARALCWAWSCARERAPPTAGYDGG